MRRLALLLVLLAAAPAGAQAPSPAPPAPCAFSAGGEHYLVSRGKVPCATARRALHRYAVKRRSPRGWRCRRGRARERFDLRCRRRSDGRVVRATAAHT